MQHKPDSSITVREADDKPSYQRDTLSSRNKHSSPKSTLLHVAVSSSDTRKSCGIPYKASSQHPSSNVPVGILKKGLYNDYNNNNIY